MKQYDDAFLALYSQYETGVSGEGKVNLKTYNRVLEKAGLNQRRSRRGLRTLLVAAVIAVASISVAAAVYTASDAFRGILDVQDPLISEVEGTSLPSTATDPILDRAGAVLGDRQTVGNIEMSLRAIVGDEYHLKILVDIENVLGEPLALFQRDGTLSEDDLSFRNCDLALQGDDHFGGMSAGWEVIDDDRTDSKSTILLTYTVDDAKVRGKTLTLSLQDLMQFADREGTSLDMGADDLYNLAAQYGAPSDDDFENSGYSADADGNVEYHYSLEADTDLHLPLGESFPGITVTNAVVWNDSFYLRGYADSARQLGALTENAALINSDGDIIHFDGMGISTENSSYSGSGRGGFSLDEDSSATWSMRFVGVPSVESLKGYVWTVGEGNGLHLLAEGVWEFTFTPDYHNTTVTVRPNQLVTWEGYPITIDKLELSPFTLFIDFTPDPANVEEMFSYSDWGVYDPDNVNWTDSDFEVILTMRDGSQITLDSPGSSYGYEYEYDDADVPTTIVTKSTLDFRINVIIEPKQVASITIGDTTIPLDR